MPDFRCPGAIRLNVIKLPRLEARHEYRPNVAPAVVVRIQRNDFIGIGIFDISVEKDAHPRC